MSFKFALVDWYSAPGY